MLLHAITKHERRLRLIEKTLWTYRNLCPVACVLVWVFMDGTSSLTR